MGALGRSRRAGRRRQAAGLGRRALLALLSALAWTFPSAALGAGNAPCRIAVLGDSLTAGYGLPSRSDAFPAQLERALRQAGFACTVLDAGVSGDTSAGALARLAWVLADRPTHLLVEIGGNDLLRGLPPDQLQRNLEAIVQGARRAGVAVFLLGMEAPRNWGEDYVAAARRAYRQVAQRYGVPLDPFFLEGAFGVPGHMQADGLHPTAAGVRAIVRRLLPAVTDWLRRTGIAPAGAP